MGADIYLRSKFDSNFESVQVEIEEVYKLFDMTADSSIMDMADGDKDKFQEMIQPLFNKAYSVGYFRDSYNSSNLLSHLGLDWWKDIIPKLDNQCLPIEHCEWLLEEIKNRRIGEEPQVSHPINEIHKRMGIACTELNLDSETLKYFVEKKIKLCNLLQDAISINEPLYCSL